MLFGGFCMALFALLLAVTVCLAGYRVFVALLPIWGFFFGFFLGAWGFQALFGVGLLSSVTSWVIGLAVGVLFAAISYLWFIVAVAINAGSLGFFVGYGLLGLLGLPFGIIAWIVGIVLAVIFAFVTIQYKIYKYVIIATTSILGAVGAIGTLVLGPVAIPITRFFENPVQVILANSPLWFILFIALAVVGIVVQLRTTKGYEFDPNQSYWDSDSSY